MKVIALFNHKGGVSKTTTTFHLGWMLAEKGHRVVLVDADSQCNLTGIVLGYKGPNELEEFYKIQIGRNIKDALAPAFESRPVMLAPVECVEVDGRNGLFLLPGHVAFSDYEVQLTLAQNVTGSLQALQNLPGSISHLINITAQYHEADYVLIDMSPSVGSINQNLLMTSDYFIIPAAPDYFSLMAIDSLSSVLPKWAAWSKAMQGIESLQDAAYPYPSKSPKFLGTIIQNYRPRGGAPAVAFQRWIDQIDDAVSNNLVPKLRAKDLTLPDDRYTHFGLGDHYKLASIANFNSLIAKSQDNNVPVFSLTEDQMDQTGNVLATSVENRDRFYDTFSDMADMVIGLTNDTATE